MKFFLDKSITLKRLKYLDINRSVYSATGTAVGYPASWQEPSPERVALYEGQIGNMFSCFVDISCPAVDADQVVKNGITYSGKDIKTMDFGSTQYKRLIVVRGD